MDSLPTENVKQTPSLDSLDLGDPPEDWKGWFAYMALKASVAETLLSLSVDEYRVCETRPHFGRAPQAALDKLKFSPDFALRVSGDLDATARGNYGVEVAFSSEAESSLLECIPVNDQYRSFYWQTPRQIRPDCFGQQEVQKGVKEITKSLYVVGVVRLPGCGPRDPACA
ncbi:hypothetical protein T265_08550 [Opisthorchis viverrini]|uniref:Uncharacterized protein n=1 Tax=Opisthorchis viverrini TaxID=6198 RepID=A0A075A820_OPIVI|nr:hypothetical protein T265_08550 [Opisthorchis viverrini]KER23614.1 hypothetical protein T265_08550 [Opisthorchis viverrini]